MKWQEALRHSKINVAERDSTDNERKPWRVVKQPMSRGRSRVMVWSGRRKKTVGKTTTLSTKSASKFDDWFPIKPHDALTRLALAMSEDD